MISLNERVCWVDVWAFEHVVSETESAIRESRGEDEMAAVAERLLKSYPGPFLGGTGGEPWVVSARERMRAKFLRQVAGLAACAENAGRWEQTISLCERGLEVDDLAEELYRRLMISYRKLGRHAEAAATFRRCRETLAAVLGVEPSPATRAIAEAIPPV
jgi:DNA-binding SARP family transcriptional activator